MSKKTNKSKQKKSTETINITIPRSDAEWIQTQLEKRDRPNIFSRMGTGIKKGTVVTGQFFVNRKDGIISSFRSFQDMSAKAEKTVLSVKNAKTKDEMIQAAIQLESIANNIKEIAGQVQVEQVSSETDKDTANMINEVMQPA